MGQAYVTNLNVLQNVFHKPLLQALEEKPIISRDDIRNIFGDVEVVLNVNSELLRSLEPRVKNWGPRQCLGDIFVAIVCFARLPYFAS
jgi:hypothetical protein